MGTPYQSVREKAIESRPRLFRRSRRTATYLFIVGAVDLVTMLALFFLAAPSVIETVDGREVSLPNPERWKLLLAAGIGAATIGAGFFALRRRGFAIRVDDVGIEDLQAGRGPIPWGAVRDVETKTSDEYELLVLHTELPQGEVRIDIGELREGDRAEIFEAVLVRWSRATGRAR
ncbi:MAG: hypothetical protein GYA21_04840 [Myxococcales bacterium]|nr:hypothetical protein [Myxococcales bacterium]